MCEKNSGISRDSSGPSSGHLYIKTRMNYTNGYFPAECFYSHRWISYIGKLELVFFIYLFFLSDSALGIHSRTPIQYHTGKKEPARRISALN